MYGLLFGVTLTAGTIVVLICALVTHVRARNQSHWIKVAGEILTSTVDYWGGSTQPKVEYKYSYEGRSFWGNTIVAPQVTLFFPDGARRVVQQFPVGAIVTVFVCPTNPERSVLVPGGDKKFIPTTMVFCGVALGVAWMAMLGRLS